MNRERVPSSPRNARKPGRTDGLSGIEEAFCKDMDTLFEGKDKQIVALTQKVAELEKEVKEYSRLHSRKRSCSWFVKNYKILSRRQNHIKRVAFFEIETLKEERKAMIGAVEGLPFIFNVEEEIDTVSRGKVLAILKGGLEDG